MKLTRYEQETVINFNNSTQTASIYTASPQMMRLDALADAFPEDYRIIGHTEISTTYSCDKNLITMRKPRRVNEEHREWVSRRMAEMNRQKNMENLTGTDHQCDVAGVRMEETKNRKGEI